MKSILETVDLVKYYGDGENQVRAIDHTSIQVQHGEFVAIVGRSGSGKSTLLHMLGGLDGKKVNKDYVMSIVENIGMEDKLHVLPNTLSGGQKQRVAIARALASRPAIILADEPTGNLDSKTEMEVMSILKNCVHKYGQTLIMITHDETIAQMADRIMIIEDGKVVI